MACAVALVAVTAAAGRNALDTVEPAARFVCTPPNDLVALLGNATEAL